jgi:NAD+--asparagine ADP-ribosyltransferase
MKFIKKAPILLLLMLLSSFAIHKFYLGMFQLEYVPQKKELQITTRIFIDDLNDAIENKYGKKTFIAEKNETEADVVLLNKYVAEKFKIYINKQQKSYVFLSKETENNVLICYYKIKDIPKINSIEIENSILAELFSEQQNIIQFNNNGKKESLLLTSETIKGMLK